MKKFSAIIFDMDGVIVDTEPLHNQAFETLFEELGKKHDHGIVFHEYYGRSDGALLRDFIDKHKLPLNDPTGAVTATVTLSFPLERDLTMDEVAIHAHAHLDGAHLGGVVAGRDLDQGAFDLDVTDIGLTLSGTAALAGIPATILCLS